MQLVNKFPTFLWNPKVHYRTHKRPPSVPILGQPIPVHIPTYHLLEIHPNIIHPSTPRSPQWYLSLQFPHQDPIRPSLLTHTRHLPSPSHSSRFYHPYNNRIRLTFFLKLFKLCIILDYSSQIQWQLNYLRYAQHINVLPTALNSQTL